MLYLAAQEVSPASLAAPWLQQGVTGTVVIALVAVVVVLWRRESSRQAKDLQTIADLRAEAKAERDARASEQLAHQKAIAELVALHQKTLADQHAATHQALATVQAQRFADQRVYSETVQKMQLDTLTLLREVSESVDGSIDFQSSLTTLVESLPKRFDRIDARLDDLAHRPSKMGPK